MTQSDIIKRRILEAMARLPHKPGLKQLSLALGRNHAYLQQYFTRGSPRILPEDIRHRLAQLLAIDPALLAHGDGDSATAPQNINNAIAIPFIEHAGSDKMMMTKNNSAAAPWHFPPALLRQYGIAESALGFLRLAHIGDDSPDLVMTRGDVVVLNTADRDPVAAGYFALDMGAHIRVRHVEQTADAITVGHNAEHGYTMLADSARILGRVLFHFRMLIQSAHHDRER